LKVENIVILGAFVFLGVGIFLSFEPQWASLLFLLISAVSFYHAGEAFLGSVSLIVFAILILRISSSLLLPIGLALVIAFIFLPVVSKLEEYKIPRWLSSFVIIVGMFIIISIFGFFVGYQVYNQGSQLLNTISRYYLSPEDLRIALMEYVKDPNIVDMVVRYYSDMLKNLGQAGFERFIPRIGDILTSSVELAFSTLIGLIMGFYALKDTKIIVSEMENLLPDRFKSVAEEAYNLLAQYFRGQLTVASFVGVFVGVMLQVLGIKYGILIGFLAGVMNLIPNLGFAMTVVLGSLIILLSETNVVWSFIKFGGVLIADQILESIITPRIIGKSVGLHPVLVIIALVMGASLFGPLGIILAVPGAAFLRSLWINKLRGKI